jgi:outer membrane lipoprotein LolB
MSRAIGIFLLIAVITGCASISEQASTTPSPYAHVPWKDRQLALNRIQSWQISGKIAVQTPNDSGSASVDWIQNQGHYNIALMGPLGSGGLKLQGQQGAVSLQMADGKRYTANSPDQLLAERWGFNVPVSNLKYWIRGLPAPSAPYSSHFDSSGRLTEITQQGWHVRFLSYTNAGNIDVPNKVFINSAALNVKIIVYSWKVT